MARNDELRLLVPRSVAQRITRRRFIGLSATGAAVFGLGLALSMPTPSWQAISDGFPRLEQKLKASNASIKIIATDGVFSQHGDIVPLPDMIQIAERFDASLAKFQTDIAVQMRADLEVAFKAQVELNAKLQAKVDALAQTVATVQAGSTSQTRTGTDHVAGPSIPTNVATRPAVSKVESPSRSQANVSGPRSGSVPVPVRTVDPPSRTA